MKNHVLKINKNYRKLFISSSISSFGDLFDMFAIITLFTYYWRADPFLVTLIPITYGLPSIIFSQIAGVLADKYNKLTLIISSEILRGILTLFLLMINNPIFALVILSLRSIGSVFKVPAHQTLIKEVVEEKSILQALSLQNIVFQISKVISPFIGGILLTFSTPKLSIFINFIAFLISLFFLLSLRKEKISQSTFEKFQHKKNISTLSTELKKGWKLIIFNQTILLAVIVFHTSYFMVMMVDAQISIFLREVLPNNPEVLGWVMSSLGLGALITGMYLSNIKYIKSPTKLISFGLILFAGTLIFTGYYRPDIFPSYSIILAATIGGIGVGINLILFNYILQSSTNQENLGKVYGVVNTLTSSVLIVAPLTGAFFVKSFNAQSTFEIAGYVTLGIGIISLFSSKIYEVNQNVTMDVKREEGG